MGDQERLAGYVDVWWQSINDFAEVLEGLSPEQWSTPTDLPGWDVRACAAHTAHLESILAGNPEESADVGEPPHITSPMGLYTEIGVINRRETEPDEIINEIREAATTRHTRLLSEPPTDGAGQPEHVFGGVPWSWEVLLRNRPLDVWMHEQDVRRAVASPGNLDSPAARHTATYLAEGFGYVLAKRVGAPSGTSAVLAIDGLAPLAFVINDSGRGERLDAAPSDATVTLRMSLETFILLAGGRRPAVASEVRVDGDASLGQQVLDQLATTP